MGGSLVLLDGVPEPKATFSALFGAPFMALHPTVYADLLGKKIAERDVHCWLVNTGWTGGSHGYGTRIKLRYTRSIIDAMIRTSNSVRLRLFAYAMLMPATRSP